MKPERLHGRVLGLDVARSGAIGLVVLAHYSLALRQWFNSDPIIYGLGYFGVELFFALSGFLIGGIVIRSVLGRRDPGTVPAFWLRRWMRTIPAYYLVLLALALAYGAPFRVWSLDAVFLQNFSPAGDEFFGVSWSLVIEEWFYLLLPIVVFALGRLTRARPSSTILGLCACGIVGCLAARFVDVWAFDPSWMEVRKSVFERMDALLFGVLLVAVKEFHGDLYGRLHRHGWWLGTASLAVWALCQRQFFIAGGLDTVFARTLMFSLVSLASALIVGWLDTSEVFNARLRGTWLANAVGFVSVTSYSVYLIHSDIFLFVVHHRQPSALLTGLMVIGSLVVTVLVATAIYYFYERPIMDLRGRLGGRGGVIATFARRLGRVLDAEVFFGVASKVANALFGLISVALVGHFLSPFRQGFFFTFLSFASLWLIAELGLTTVLIQFTSHECAAIDAATSETERAEARSRLASIARFGLLWFGAAALAFLVLGGIAGYIFFDHLPGGAEAAVGPWPLLAFAVACDIAFLPVWSLLEGAGHVRSVYSYRTYRVVCLGLGTWVTMILGGGLWSLPCGYVAVLPLSLYTAFVRHGAFLRSCLVATGPARVNWLKELMPMQWRLAVVCASGYGASWLIIPVCMKLIGPVSAGHIGMAISLAIGVSSVGSAVVMVKFRRFGTLVALQRWKELDRLVLRQGLAAVGLMFIGSAAVFLAAAVLTTIGHPFATRLPSLPTTGGILAANLMVQATLPMAAYLRAHKREPFLWLSVGQACFTILGILIFAPRFGEIGVAFGFLIAAVFFVCPVATGIFLHCRRTWRQTDGGVHLADLEPLA